MSVAAAAREGCRRSVEVAIIDCCRRWAMECPAEAVGIKFEVDRLRQTSVRDRGWSRDKHFILKGSVPVSLHLRMCREIDKNWLWNYEIRDIFFRLFKIGCVNTSDLSRR